MAKIITSNESNSSVVDTVRICGVAVNSKKSAKNIAKILRINGVTLNDLHSNSKQIERAFGRPFYVQLLAKLYDGAPISSYIRLAEKAA